MGITEIFNSFAFPTAVVIACFGAMVKMYMYHREDIKEKDNQHNDEVTSFTSALNRNTVVLERLCTMLDDKEGTRNEEQPR